MSVHIIDSSDGDWIALYKDGVKVAEGHSIYVTEALEVLGIEFTKEEVDVDPYDPESCFPDKLP